MNFLDEVRSLIDQSESSGNVRSKVFQHLKESSSVHVHVEVVVVVIVVIVIVVIVVVVIVNVDVRINEEDAVQKKHQKTEKSEDRKSPLLS